MTINWSWLLLLLLVAPGLQAAERFVGYAYDIDSGQLQYLERHQRTFNDGQLVRMDTRYVDAAGQMIANRSVTYRDDQVMRFTLDDSGGDQRVTAQRTDNAVVVERRIGGKDKPKTTLQEAVKDGVIDAGFSNFLRRNWQSLVDGNTLRFDFLSTESADWVRIQLRHVGQVDDNGTTIDQFEMTAANPVIRMIMTPVKIDYYTDTRELYRYQGVSNLKRQNGKNYRVRIEFPRADYVTASAND